MLEIRNLHAVVEGEELKILKGVNLTVNKGEIHAIMGPNGSGKSTLSKVVSGHPEYEVTEGSILFDGKDITEMDADERAHLGLFLAFCLSFHFEDYFIFIFNHYVVGFCNYSN